MRLYISLQDASLARDIAGHRHIADFTPVVRCSGLRQDLLITTSCELFDSAHSDEAIGMLVMVYHPPLHTSAYVMWSVSRGD